MGKISVLQLNMQFGQIWNDDAPDTAPVRIEDTIATLKEYDADVIVLQEVEQAAVRAVQEDENDAPHYEALKVAFSEYDSYFAYPERDPKELPFGVGLAIFSKYPLSGFRKENLPASNVEFDFFGTKTNTTDRVVIKAEIDVGGKKVTLVNTHLQAYFMINSTSDEHPLQRDISLSLAEEADGPVLLCGDFNSAPVECLVETYKLKSYQVVQTDKITWKRIPFVLDHIFYKGGVHLNSYQIDEVACSDHHVLMTEFEV